MTLLIVQQSYVTKYEMVAKVKDALELTETANFGGELILDNMCFIIFIVTSNIVPYSAFEYYHDYVPYML